MKKHMRIIVLVGVLVGVWVSFNFMFSMLTGGGAESKDLAESESKMVRQQPAVLNNYSYDSEILSSEMLVDGDNYGSFDAAVLNEAVQPVTLEFEQWQNQVEANLTAYQENVGNGWVPFYDLAFESRYQFRYGQINRPTTLEFIFPFPTNLETLHDVEFLVNGEEPTHVEYTPSQIRWVKSVKEADEFSILVRYKANGARDFIYGLQRGTRTSNLDVRIVVDGLTGSERSLSSLPETEINELGNSSEEWVWAYDNLIVERDIHLSLPKKLTFSGRLASQQDSFANLIFFAPFLTLLFIGLLAGFSYWEKSKLNWATYILAGVGFILFYPLLTILAGLIPLAGAVLLAFMLIAGLLFSFFKLMDGGWQSAMKIGWLLFILLGLVSVGLISSYTGLLLVIASLLLIGTAMVSYAKNGVALEPEVGLIDFVSERVDLSIEEVVEEDTAVEVAEEIVPVVPEQRCFCPRCGRAVALTDSFCASCGYDTRIVDQCDQCGHEQIVQDGQERFGYCLHCGATRKSD